MLQNSKTLYEQIVEIAGVYLGNNSRVLIDRQIRSHLNKNPEEITERDFEMLLDWIRAMAGMLIESPAERREFVARMSHLARHGAMATG